MELAEFESFHSSPTTQPITSSAEIAARYAEVRERAAQAARRSGRDPSDVTILAVTKNHPTELIANAFAAGIRDFGENYVQDALAKISGQSLPTARWHLIGHLQSNKVKAVIGRFDLIQTVDSAAITERFSGLSMSAGKVQDILIQMKLGDEQSKFGIPADSILPLCDEIAALPGVRIRGLMAIAPLFSAGAPVADPRPYFAAARGAFEQLPVEFRAILSMGMSSDFEAAIAEGSTMIRIGTMLFGPRPEPRVPS